MKNYSWKPPADWQKITTVEMHTAGEPLRVILSGLPDIKGKTILEKISFFRENHDQLRTGLMLEPRGHADMYGAIITEPTTHDGDFGVFFLHNEGYSTMCGHAIIALTKFAVETGLVQKKGNKPVVLIDAPPGRIEAKARLKKNRVEEVSFINVPSFVLLKDKEINIDGFGSIPVDVAYGGAFYVIADARDFDLELIPEEYNRLIDLGRRIKQIIIDCFPIRHPIEKELSFLYGTIFTGPAKHKDHHSRNVCIFAEGEVDRSPTGTGVSARSALHFNRGTMDMGTAYTIESLLDTTMDVKITRQVRFGDYEAVIPEVSGKAYFTGTNSFYFDPGDPLNNGFIFR